MKPLGLSFFVHKGREGCGPVNIRRDVAACLAPRVACCQPHSDGSYFYEHNVWSPESLFPSAVIYEAPSM